MSRRLIVTGATLVWRKCPRKWVPDLGQYFPSFERREAPTYVPRHVRRELIDDRATRPAHRARVQPVLMAPRRTVPRMKR